MNLFELDDFAEDVVVPDDSKVLVEMTPPIRPNKMKEEKVVVELPDNQWAFYNDTTLYPVGKTAKSLPSNSYTVDRAEIGFMFNARDLKIDDLIVFPDSIQGTVLKEISNFWELGDKFKEYGFLHRRGYLFYGPAGCGKTALVRQIANAVISSGDLVILCESPNYLLDGLAKLRTIEPNRRLVCIFEDIDAIIKHYGEDKILSILDGDGQIDKVLNLATSNYPELLDRRIVSRPRRFDRVIKMDMPTKDMRKLYLSKKLNINGDDLLNWVEKTSGFSFAALAELVISVKCLGNNFDNSVQILKHMSSHNASSGEFRNGKLGLTKE